MTEELTIAPWRLRSGLSHGHRTRPAPPFEPMRAEIDRRTVLHQFDAAALAIAQWGVKRAYRNQPAPPLPLGTLASGDGAGEA